MKRKIRLLSLLLMTAVAMMFCNMTANGSESNEQLTTEISAEAEIETEADAAVISEDAEDASADPIADSKTATVTAAKLNMRCGVSTEYAVVKILSQGQKLSVIEQIGNWYVVREETEGYIGCVSGSYISFDSGNTDSGDTSIDNDSSIPDDVETLLALVNNVRKNNGLSELTYNAELSRVAYHKAMDMVENNYFSHESPVYGSPFQMIKSYGISFSAAAENIAGNQSVEQAFNAWMNSSGHAANILSPNYTETGIGIYKSPVYGLVLVQMFITP